MRNHPNCHRGVSGRRFSDKPGVTVLPPRVIDVGLGDGAHARLLETQDKRGCYVALSYCWEPELPGKPPLKLLRGNRSDLEERLPLSELPPTIQDAIDFTRRLGISYIWIDRLCIMQDDNDDWKGHAAKMCDIYEAASLTLAALGARARDEGLYLSREERPSVRVQCSTKDGEIGYMRIARRFDPGEEHGNVRYDAAFGQELGMSRWNTRGWVMQERFISRRIVYFGRRQIFWECYEITRKEDGIGGDGGVGSSARGEEFGAGDGLPKQELNAQLAWYQRLAWLRARFPSLAGEALPSFWISIIKDYSKRQLSFGTDKQKAMTGIAEAVKYRLGTPNYAHGISLEFADRLLMWHPKAGSSKPESPRGKATSTYLSMDLV